ncbi:Myc-type, basic helix-loop-helix domain-containing protein [Phycomyces blakesleeanus]
MNREIYPQSLSSSRSSLSSESSDNSSSSRSLPPLTPSLYTGVPLPPMSLPVLVPAWSVRPRDTPQVFPSASPNIRMKASEREQKRRLSHSAIEKRRRERMNDKIKQLKNMIPSCRPDGAGPVMASMYQPIHKLSVLQAAIDYIGQLHQQIQDLSTNTQETSSSSSSSSSSASSSSSSLLL